MLRGVKRTTHSQAPSQKQHLAYLCLPWPELWAVSTATSTADSKPAVLLFMSVLHNYLPFSILPLLFPSPQPWALVELPNLRKSPYLAIRLRFIIIIIMVGVGRRQLRLACMSPPSFTNLLLLWLCVGCCWASSERWIYSSYFSEKLWYQWWQLIKTVG